MENNIGENILNGSLKIIGGIEIYNPEQKTPLQTIELFGATQEKIFYPNAQNKKGEQFSIIKVSDKQLLNLSIDFLPFSPSDMKDMTEIFSGQKKGKETINPLERIGLHINKITPDTGYPLSSYDLGWGVKFHKQLFTSKESNTIPFFLRYTRTAIGSMEIGYIYFSPNDVEFFKEKFLPKKL